MDNFSVRTSSMDEFKTAVTWADAEGWNPGLDDLPPFFAADPNGFLMGYLNGVPISSISVVRYGDSFGFLGFYIVHPNYRSKGYGIATWQAGMSYLEGRTIGLDGVVDQQPNYAKSGFTGAGRTIRYAGAPQVDLSVDHGVTIESVGADNMDDISNMDSACFPAPRSPFLHVWKMPPDNANRHSFAAIIDGALVGHATIRKCGMGYKIGPLFAKSQAAAYALFSACCQKAGTGETVIIDIPEKNEAGAAMAQQAGLVPVFETARMYTGAKPELRSDWIYGNTTLELG